MSYEQIIVAISEKIVQELQSQGAEETHPLHDADASGDFLKAQREKVVLLREMRSSLEEIAAGRVWSLRVNVKGEQ